jgi:drug/metabolite transporter (DMT)-like permease
LTWRAPKLDAGDMPIDAWRARDTDPAHRKDVLVGIVCRLAATLLFGAMGAVVRAAAEAGIPILEIIFFRSAFGFIPIGAFILLTTGPRIPRTNRPMEHAKRAVWGILTLFFTFTAISMLPLSSAVALGFAAPLFLTLLSGPMLRERVGPQRWMATMVGFGGVAVMLNPSFADMANLGSAFALAGALFTALATVTIRQLASEPAVVTTFYFTVATTLVSALTLPFIWVTPDNLGVLLLLLLTGVIGGLAQLLMTQSLRLAPPALLVSLDYTQLIWASLLGFAIWHEIPAVRALIGGSVIIICGCYIILSEIGPRNIFRVDPPAP